jgi:hypothetical protein
MKEVGRIYQQTFIDTHAKIAFGGLLKRQSKDQRLNLGRRAIGQKRLAPRQLLSASSPPVSDRKGKLIAA